MTKTIIAATIMALGMTACGDYTGDTTGDTTATTKIDNSVTDNSDRSYTVTDSNGTTTYFSATDPEALTDKEIEEGVPSDEIIGAYDATYNQEECGAAGFFWCTISETCQNSAAYGSSCSIQE